MFKDTKELLDYLRNVDSIYRRIKDLEEKIASKTYRVTASYEGSGGSSGYNGTSQIEVYVETMIELKNELARCKERLRVVQTVNACGVLSKEEQDLLEWIQLGGKISDYARNKGIYISNAYKVRDKALKKVLDFVKTHESDFKVG